MAEQNPETAELLGIEVKTVSAPLDDLARLVQEKFTEARTYRRDHETHWQESYDAYRGKYPSHINKSTELAHERGIFVNQTRRKVNSAKIKIGTLLFEDGRIPFSITPSRKPRFIPPDLDAPAGRPDLLEDAIKARAENMEDRIRDILDRTEYNQAVQHTIHEMCLYGTGCTKAISLERKNFPVFRSSGVPGYMLEVEESKEEELVPAVKHVSVWNIFPSPEAESPRDADYIIQRSFVSPKQLREMAKTDDSFIPGSIESVLDQGLGERAGYDESQHPRVYDESSYVRVKSIEILEFWGKVDVKDFKPYLNLEDDDMRENLDVVMTVIGDKVVRMEENPFDGEIPYHFCYWQKNPETIWGDGIYYAIRDVQAILNFSYAMMVEGKALASVPITVVDPNAFEAGEDTEQMYAGKQIRLKPGQSVRDAFQAVVLPDVTNGLISLIQQLEREADLDSGQTAIGYGDMSPSQTKTATGMSILNSNANRQTADVVRSVSNMITSNIQSIYRWLMVDSPDPTIKGDYEAISTGYEQYVAKEVHNTQLIQFLQVAGSLPQFQAFIKHEAFTRPLLRAFNLDPEHMLKTEDEVAMEMQQGQQAQQQAMMQQQQSQQQAIVNQIQAKAQADMQMEQLKATLNEKKAISDDQREMEIRERLELIKQGNVLHPANLATSSILLREQMQQEQQAQIQQQAAMQQQQLQMAQQAEQNQGVENNARDQLEQQEMESLQEVANKRMERGMDRMQGGQDAEDIRRQEMEENAPAE